MQQLQLWQAWAAGQIDDATAQAAAEAHHTRNDVSGRGGVRSDSHAQRPFLSHGEASAETRYSGMADAYRSTGSVRRINARASLRAQPARSAMAS